MFTLVVCNPLTGSLTYDFLNTAVAELRRSGAAFEIIDIYQDDIASTISPEHALIYNDGVVFDDMADIMALLRRSDTLCFFFPVWMYGIPAPLKGMLEKIVRPDITFRISGDGVTPLLTNIQNVIVVCSSGQRNSYINEDQDPVLYSLRAMAIDNFGSGCDVQYLRLFGTDHTDQTEIDEFRATIASHFSSLLNN